MSVLLDPERMAETALSGIEAFAMAKLEDADPNVQAIGHTALHVLSVLAAAGLKAAIAAHYRKTFVAEGVTFHDHTK